MGALYMRIKEFEETFGVPHSMVLRMLRSEWVNTFAQKIDPAKTNSPWIIYVPKALKMLREGYWR